MDVREKLVELIFDSLCCHEETSYKLAENIAGDLIAEGVTVQEWVSVKEHLPQENEPEGKVCELVQVLLV